MAELRIWSIGALLLAGLISTAEAHGLCPGELDKAMKIRQRIVREWPLRPSADEVSQYVQNLGLRLAARYGAEGQAINWRFTLVRNLAPNAFSIGAGNVFVNEGAISFAQNEAELAAILAHELAHELAGHFCEPSPPNASRSLFDIFAAPETQRYETNDMGSMTQIIDPVKERQADQIAVSILRAAGFNPLSMLDVARRLPSGTAGHLPDASRIQALQQTMPNMPQTMTNSSDEFRRAKQILGSQ
ncbi:MAG: M48 family metallopeptidase [Methylomonas sp.]